MLKQSLRQLVANKARLVSMALAITLSVAFVAASFMLGDGLRGTLDTWADQATVGFDLEVAGENPDGDGVPEPVTPQALEQIRGVDGVDKANPQLVSFDLTPASPDGGADPSTVNDWDTVGWVDGNGYTLVDGDAPTEANQFTVDVVTAEDLGYVIGQTYDVATPDGNFPMELTGTMQFGATKAALPYPTIALQLEELQTLLDRTDFDAVRITLDSDAELTEVQTTLEETLPELTVSSAAQVRSDIVSENGDFIAEFQNILLGFGALSVFVSAFVIYNTFNVVLGQRTRELGLMRAVGASPKQLKRAMRIEALLVGAVSSVIGIVVGIGLNQGLVAILNAGDAGLPESDLVLAPRTIIVCLLVGIVVTVVAASGPARKACNVPPIAAIRDGSAAGQSSSKKRMIIGGTITVFGLVLGGAGLTGLGSVAATVAAMAGGGAAVFIGVAMLSPLGVGPIVSVLGWPAQRFFGVSGNLAQGNTQRNPQRSATTAAALMIGLALISMVLVVGHSVKSAVSSQSREAYQGEYIFGNPGDIGGIGPEIAPALEALDVVDQTFYLSTTFVEIDSEELEVAVGDYQSLPGAVDLQLVEGVTYSASNPDSILVHQQHATNMGINVDDVVPVTFDSGETRDLTVIGIYTNSGGIVFLNHLIDSATVAQVTDNTYGTQVVISATDDTSDEAFRAAAEPVLAEYENVDEFPLRNVDEYISEFAGQLDQLLAVVNAMMLLAVVIAMLGIANTLALSIFERTNEIGLLRAVGMKRRQLRRMIRYEAILLSLFGAVLGIVVGIGFGAASAAALPDSWATFAVPVGNLAVLLVGAGIAGLLAAILPARRASKMNPLDAIAN